MVVAVVASLGAAVLYAVASVLQHKAAVAVSPELSMRLGLLTRLIARPLWLAGIAADTVAFLLQFIALGNGPLVVVQPLLVSGLLFALPLGSWVSGLRIRLADLRASAMVVLGLGLLLLFGNPTKGTSAFAGARWVVLTVAVAVPVFAAIFAAGRVAGRAVAARPGLLAAAAGCIYGYTAALAKVAAHALDQGVGHALATWQVWALIPGGLIGMVVCQSAFQAGPLKSSLPTLTAVDPIVSILIGVFAFDEHVDGDPLHLVAVIGGTALMVAGIMILGRSPLVALEDEPAERSADRAHHP